MQIAQRPPLQTRLQPAPTPPPAPPNDPKPPQDPNCTAPEDGLSHYDPKKARWLRPATRLLVGLAERADIRGAENVPATGNHLVCFNHQHYLDAPTVAIATNRDVRYMAAKEEFTGWLGKAMSAMGAFPVDRKSHSARPLEVGIDLMKTGHAVGIYPEGRIHTPSDTVHDFKEGAAMMALKSDCETVVPGAIHYVEGQAPLGQLTAAYAAAAGVTAAGVLSALYGGPVLRTVSGVLTGAVAGGVVAGGVAMARVKENWLKDKAFGFIDGAWKGALAGAALGGLGGAYLGNTAWLAAPLSGVTGLATLVAGKHLAGRMTAKVLIGKGIPVAPYRAMENKKEARSKLTEDVHQAMLDLKKQLVAESQPKTA